MGCRYGCWGALGDRNGRGNHGRRRRLLVEQRVAQRGCHRRTEGDRTIHRRDYSPHDDASHGSTTDDNAADDNAADDNAADDGTTNRAAAHGSAGAG
jgi:hypothetical protein